MARIACRPGVSVADPMATRVHMVLDEGIHAVMGDKENR